MLQVPAVTLKMSTTLEKEPPTPTAQGVRHTHTPYKATPHATTQTKPTTRTEASSEDRDSKVRQRCGCKTKSSCAESSSAPSSCRHVQDVHNIGVATVRCTRRETLAHSQIKSHSCNSGIPLTKQRLMQQLKQNQQHVLTPPAKIATPRFGSDVAAR